MSYTKSGGSYVVARDNFGPERRAGGSGGIADRLHGHGRGADVGGDRGAVVGISSAEADRNHDRNHCRGHMLMLFGNLRGIREAGSIFAIPTYFYVVSLSLVVIIGLVKGVLGGLHVHALPSARHARIPVGSSARIPHGAGDLLLPARFRKWRILADRDGSSLQRHLQLPQTRSAKRTHRAPGHVRDPRIPRPGDVVARALDPRGSVCQWQPDGGLAGGAVRPRQHVGRAPGSSISCRRRR